MPDPASIAEQVDAILRGRAPFFVMERYGLDDPSHEQYLETYTIGRQGILEFLEANQIRVEDYGQFHGPSTIFERNGMGDAPRDKYPPAKRPQPWWRRVFGSGA